MRLGVNAAFLTPLRGGMSTFALEHVGALHRVCPEIEPVVFATGAGIGYIREHESWADQVELIRLPSSNSTQRPARVINELGLLPARLRRARIDVLHSLANFGPPFCGVPHVLTVHDLIYRHYPAQHPGIAYHVIDQVVPRVAARATLVATPSEATRADVLTLPRTDPARVHVVPMGPGQARKAATAEAELRGRLGLGERRVVLSVGAGFEHKNVGRLVEAFARVGPQRGTVLVHAGPKLFEGSGWVRRARELGIEDDVRWAGFEQPVSDADLEGLFATAELLVHPALLEGFGMLPLEAMARGLPVACSTAPSLVEVAGDAAEFFDPADSTAIGAAIARLLDQPERREQLVAAGKKRVAQFSWERTARAYRDLYGLAVERRAAAA